MYVWIRYKMNIKKEEKNNNQNWFFIWIEHTLLFLYSMQEKNISSVTVAINIYYNGKNREFRRYWVISWEMQIEAFILFNSLQT